MCGYRGDDKLGFVLSSWISLAWMLATFIIIFHEYIEYIAHKIFPIPQKGLLHILVLIFQIALTTAAFWIFAELLAGASVLLPAAGICLVALLFGLGERSF